MKHSHAAYLASFASCSKHCKFVVRNFTLDTTNQNSHIMRALDAYNTNVLPGDKITLNPDNTNLCQNELSEAIDRALITTTMDGYDMLNKAHFNLQRAPRAGAWLNALPSDQTENNITRCFVFHYAQEKTKNSYL